MIEIIPFEESHIPYKVKWINNPKINEFLHYDVPLTLDGTKRWYRSKSKNRKDCTIIYEDHPVGIIGILDVCDSQGEFYITLGEKECQGKGIGFQASKMFLHDVFQKTKLKTIYLTTEPENQRAHKLFEKIGFKFIRYDKNQLYYELDRLTFYMRKKIKGKLLYETPIIGPYKHKGNNIYIKRDDLYPYSIGGNKAKKISIIEQNYDFNDYDVIITYGSKQSNHVRATLQLALKYDLEMHVVTTDSEEVSSSNSYINNLFNVFYYHVSVSEVSIFIEKLRRELKNKDQNVFFIPGGGHLSEGTHAYALTMKEIQTFELYNDFDFDLIFHASGTGGTQAGLIAGELVNFGDPTRIIGISVGRRNVRGKQHIKNAVDEYLKLSLEYHGINFRDDIVPYQYSIPVQDYFEIMKLGIKKFDLELDPTYTSKSFSGMLTYLNKHDVKEQNILYIHTGGKTIFYDTLHTI